MLIVSGHRANDRLRFFIEPTGIQSEILTALCVYCFAAKRYADIFVTRSPDGGASFSPAVNVSDSAGASELADLAVDEAGVVYVNRAADATTSAWTGGQPFGGWKRSGTAGKAGGGPYYLQQYLREQSRTVVT